MAFLWLAGLAAGWSLFDATQTGFGLLCIGSGQTTCAVIAFFPVTHFHALDADNRAFVNRHNPAALREMAERTLAQRLERVNGVASVTVQGGLRGALRTGDIKHQFNFSASYLKQKHGSSAEHYGFTSFATAVQPGERFYYSAIGIEKPTEREVGRGTMQGYKGKGADPRAVGRELGSPVGAVCDRAATVDFRTREVRGKGLGCALRHDPADDLPRHGGGSLLCELIDVFLENSPRMIHEARAALESVTGDEVEQGRELRVGERGTRAQQRVEPLQHRLHRAHGRLQIRRQRGRAVRPGPAHGIHRYVVAPRDGPQRLPLRHRVRPP